MGQWQQVVQKACLDTVTCYLCVSSAPETALWKKAILVGMNLLNFQHVHVVGSLSGP